MFSTYGNISLTIMCKPVKSNTNKIELPYDFDTDGTAVVHLREL